MKFLLSNARRAVLNRCDTEMTRGAFGTPLQRAVSLVVSKKAKRWEVLQFSSSLYFIQSNFEGVTLLGVRP
jgi:hypothetical protein